MPIAIRRAASSDLPMLAPLFDSYRTFYAQPSDPARARDFLRERLERADSVLLLATRDDGAGAGFAQLYPTFSSVRTQRLWILNDLYVAPETRRRGVARALLDAARAFARDTGALRLELETTRDNAGAQALYRSAGWRDYDHTARFHLPLTD